MDANTLTAATALFLAIAAVFGGAVALLVASAVVSLPHRLARFARSDSRIHAGGESR